MCLLYDLISDAAFSFSVTAQRLHFAAAQRRTGGGGTAENRWWRHGGNRWWRHGGKQMAAAQRNPEKSGKDYF